MSLQGIDKADCAFNRELGGSGGAHLPAGDLVGGGEGERGAANACSAR